jgi:translation initiation factor 4E
MPVLLFLADWMDLIAYCVHVTRPLISHNATFFLLSLFTIEWVLWEHQSTSGAKDPSKWKENMKQLCEFETVEDFWKYFNHLPRPSEVFFDGDCRKKVGLEEKTIEEYSLFKKGIEPEWGDPENVIGGEWFCRQYFELDVLDLYWRNLVVGVISETIEDSADEDRTFEDHINGCRVVDKSRNYPMYKLEIWMKTRDPQIKERIRDRIVEVMTDGQPPSKKTQPKFDWKNHSA